MKRDSPSYETLIFPYGVRFHKKYTVTSLPEKVALDKKNSLETMGAPWRCFIAAWAPFVA
ncbi:hypothetical protein [Fretibacterium sp. OH1220_COT-178]|uniref:hypothetical protein n=1 Tax=Fretibacterium sp. OH1220_COT-178 TaxID=2491047 RepID=UPI000F5E1D73|nr:hypothetical protein [Fretibacterium sp. OH1220_COT-178]